MSEVAGGPRGAGLDRRVVLGVLGATATGVLPAFLVGGLAVQIRADLGFDDAALGLAVGMPFATAAVTSAGLGRVGEHIGPDRALRLAASGSAVVMLLVAVAARSWGVLAALLAVSGIDNALAQPAANLYLARAVPPGRLGWALALKQSSIPAGTLLGGLAVPTVGVTVGWRWAFVAGAALAAAAAVALPRAARPAGAPPRPAGHRRAGDVPLGPLVVLGAGAMLGAAAAGAGAAFLVTAGVAAGIEPGPAGILLTLGSAMGIAHRLYAGRRADRMGPGRLRVVAAMLAVGAAGFLLFSLTSEAGYLLGTPLAFGVGWAWPGLFNLAVVRTNPNAPGAATGITQTGTYLGALSGPLVFGVLADAHGYGPSWLAVAAASLLGAATMVLGRALVQAHRRPGAPTAR